MTLSYLTYKSTKFIIWLASPSSRGGCGHLLELRDAHLDALRLLLGGDALLDVVDDPRDHVVLLEAALDVLHLQLVVQSALHLLVHLGQALAVRRLQLQGHVLLLGLPEVLLSVLLPDGLLVVG